MLRLSILVTAMLMALQLMYANGEPYVIERLSAPIIFDGKVDDPAWIEIEPLPLTMHLPTYQGQMTEYTQIRIAYDDDFLYLSGVMFDKEPDKIMANSKKRDALIGTTEWFGFVIDSYNDKQNALAFFTTPTGLRLDGNVQNDANGSNPVNFDWNNFWDAEATRDDRGWYAEIRVPFSSLAFQPVDGRVVIGLSAWRYVARKGEVQLYPAIPPEFGDFSAWKPSEMQECVLEKVEGKKPFYVTPYILAGMEEINELNDAETAYDHSRDPVFEAGLDVKYGISNNWTMDVSVNTDFAQVEADDQQVNLTRFNLFFPEKRLFFQERAGIFNFNWGRSDQLFYSRRIGIYDGRPIRIYGGLRLVGRNGPWDIGFLSMQTEAVDTINSQNHTVFRINRQIINQFSRAGLIVTNQMDFKGYYNTTYGIDATIRVWGDDYLSLRFAQTIASDKVNKMASLQPSKFWISLGRQSTRGFRYGFSFSRRGEDYDPVLGFEVREDFTRVGSRLEYNWFGGEASRIFLHGPEAGGAIHWGNETGRLQSVQYRFGYRANFKNTATIGINFRPQVENLDEDFELTDDVTIPVDDYTFYGFDIMGNTPFTRRANALAEFQYGQFYDGTKLTVGFTPTWTVNPSLEISGFYQYNNIQFDSRDEEAIIHLARIKGLVMFTTKFSVSAFIQYNSLDKIFAGNIRLRYNPREGNDLYIVYNDNLNSDLNREIPVRPRVNARSILVKYSYTFRI